MVKRKKLTRKERRIMPKRIEQSYMIVKTDKGYIKIDRDGNKFPVDEKKSEITEVGKKEKS